MKFKSKNSTKKKNNDNQESKHWLFQPNLLIWCKNRIEYCSLVIFFAVVVVSPVKQILNTRKIMRILRNEKANCEKKKFSFRFVIFDWSNKSMKKEKEKFCSLFFYTVDYLIFSFSKVSRCLTFVPNE